MKNLRALFLLAAVAIAGVPACKPADAATVIRSSPQAFTPLVDRIAFATGDQTDVTITGLNGDADGDYDCDGEIVYKGNSGSVAFTLSPFGAGVTTGLLNLIEYNNGSGVYVGSSSGAPNPGWFIGLDNAATDNSVIWHAHLTSKTGRKRQYFAWATAIRINAGVVTAKTMGWSTDTTTNITSLTQHAGAANSQRVGSYIKCRALGSTI